MDSIPQPCWRLPATAATNAMRLSFDYGQRHRHGTRAGRASGRAPRRRGASDGELRSAGVWRLGADGRYRGTERAARRTTCRQDIPITYVPARNTIFLSFALAWAEVLGSTDIFIGVNALDYSGYPDCRPEYIEAFERMANLATRAGVEGTQRLKIHTPLIQLTKAEIIRAGLRARRGLLADQQLLRSLAGRTAVRAVRLVPAARKGLRRSGLARSATPSPALSLRAHRRRSRGS